MEMNIHHDSKTVDIWLTGSEARDESFRRSLEPYYRQFAKHKYFVSVFESGAVTGYRPAPPPQS